MHVDRFILATRDDELDAVLSGATTSVSAQSKRPFGTFCAVGLEKLELGGITAFAGSASTEKLLLLRVIAAKLGSRRPPNGVSEELFDEYLRLCTARYVDFSGRAEIDVVHISLDDVDEYAKDSRPRSPLELYDKSIRSGALVFLEEPERYLTLEEQSELAYHIECMADSGTQFVMTSNSAAFLGIKNAVIYDFDERPVLPHTWHCSRLARAHESFYAELIKKHHINKKEENA